MHPHAAHRPAPARLDRCTARAGRTVSLVALAALVAAAALTGMPGAAAAQPGSAGPPPAAPLVDLARLDYGLRARELAPGAYVVEGANADFSVPNGCNIINTGFFTTGAGVVVVNTGTSRRYGEQLRALIARTTDEPVVQVLHLNLHPDYFLGNQAFADVPRLATPATRAGMAREAAAYENNLYRLCGDWMKGTEVLLPDRDLAVPPAGQRWRVGRRGFELVELRGHTDSDLVLIDPDSGIAFVGGLVFTDRVPTTPHADLPAWQASLQRLSPLLAAAGVRQVVPSHGPVHALTPAEQGAGRGLLQTRRFLQWLDGAFTRWAREGWDMNEVLRAPVPAEFRGWAAFDSEYIRNVAHLYPRYERATLAPSQPTPGR